MTRSRRVLMVSPHFPPDSSAASHRVRLLAPYLGEHGWEPDGGDRRTGGLRGPHGRRASRDGSGVAEHRASPRVVYRMDAVSRFRRPRHARVSRTVAQVSRAFGKSTLRLLLRHHLPIISGSSGSAPQTQPGSSVRARLSRPLGRRVGAHRGSESRRDARSEEPRVPVDRDHARALRGSRRRRHYGRFRSHLS